MTRILFLGFILATLSACKTISARSAAEATEEVGLIMKEYNRAFLDEDADAFEKILARDFTLIEPENGQLLRRAWFIDLIRTGRLQIWQGRSSGAKIRVYGDVAVVHGQWTCRGRFDGVRFDGRYQYTTIYVKSGGGWKVMSEQLTALEV